MSSLKSQTLSSYVAYKVFVQMSKILWVLLIVEMVDLWVSLQI